MAKGFGRHGICEHILPIFSQQCVVGIQVAQLNVATNPVANAQFEPTVVELVGIWQRQFRVLQECIERSKSPISSDLSRRFFPAMVSMFMLTCPRFCGINSKEGSVWSVMTSGCLAAVRAVHDREASSVTRRRWEGMVHAFASVTFV
jgi:hypothetical protein